MNEPRTYQHSLITQVFVILFVMIAMGGICFAFGFVLESPLLTIPFFVLAAIFFGFAIFSYTSKTSVSEEEITTRNLLGSKTLRWTEIRRVSGRGYGIKLHDFDEDVTVAPSTRLPGYEEVVEWIGRKRPDLFSSQEYSEMKRGIGSVFGAAIAVLAVTGFIVLFVFVAEPASDVTLNVILPIIFLGVLILSLVGTFLSSPQSVTIEGGTLLLKYLFNEKNLRANEIASVNYSYIRTRNGKRYFIALSLADGKSLRISRLNISLPIAYLVLKNWHARNT